MWYEKTKQKKFSNPPVRSSFFCQMLLQRLLMLSFVVTQAK